MHSILISLRCHVRVSNLKKDGTLGSKALTIRGMDKESTAVQLSLAAFRDPVVDHLAALSRLYVPAYPELTRFVTD